MVCSLHPGPKLLAGWRDKAKQSSTKLLGDSLTEAIKAELGVGRQKEKRKKNKKEGRR